MDNAFDPDLIRAIFKLKWNKKALERQKNENTETLDGEVVAGTSKKNQPTSEAVQHTATAAEVEGVSKIQATHLERILPQWHLDAKSGWNCIRRVVPSSKW